MPPSDEKVDVNTLLQPVQPGLQHVEQKLKSVDDSVFAPLAQAFVHLIGSGGKRLRPALALMAAQVMDAERNAQEDERVLYVAAAVEMLHTATLVHDDVIDGALLRRGAPTLNARWGQGSTVLAGTYMFAQAADFAAATQNMRVINIFSDMLNTIVNGELRQIFARHEYMQAPEEYYQRIYAKTASLFSAATEMAAVLAELPEPLIDSLKAYGYDLGMAFQIVDDILDFTGDETTLGKPAGSDLRQGTLTLPFFYFLQAHPAPEQVTALLEEQQALADDVDPAAWHETVAQIVTQVNASGAIAAARQEAEQFLQNAQTNLEPFPHNVYKQSMLKLCTFVVQRTY